MSCDSQFIYNVPADLAGTYRGKPLRLRTNDPGSLLGSLDENDLDLLVSIQIEDLDCDLTALQQFSYAVPLELMVTDPAVDFYKLYAFSALVESFPIRACIPLYPGFSKAVRVAAALHFAVKLEMGQPEAANIPELIHTLDFYLHSSGVTEPIECFHSLLLACCHNQAINLWEVQEEAPLMFRYVDVAGKETFPGRLAGCRTLPAHPAAHPDCQTCLYHSPCEGYFKWPDHSYDCEGIKKLFESIEAAAAQLRADIVAAETSVS